MTPTPTQLLAVAKMTYGSVTLCVQSATVAIEVIRDGAGPAGSDDTFRKYTFTITSFIEGSDLGNLKSQIDTLRSNLAVSGQNFALYREAQQVYNILAADCLHGPTAALTMPDEESPGVIQTLQVTVTALVPVSVTSGLVRHLYTDAFDTDYGELQATSRRGTVTTLGASAKDWINAHLPVLGAGFTRRVKIDTDKTDTEATYSVDDSKRHRNAVPGEILSHIFTDTEETENSVIVRTQRSGTVLAVIGEDAYDWINANLPALDTGFLRKVSISVDDTRREGTYTVTDEKASDGDWPGDLSSARLDTRTSINEQYQKLITKSGRFVGTGAQDHLDAVRASMANIITEETTYETYGEQGITFSFTALLTKNNDGLLAWQETVAVEQNGNRRGVVLYPGRDPLVYTGEALPVVITITGSAEAAEATQRFIAPPGDPVGLSAFRDGAPRLTFGRSTERRRVTQWTYRYIVGTVGAVPSPRNPIVAYIG